MHTKKMLQSLQEIVGKEFVTTDLFATFAYSEDASNFGGTHAAGVVRPGSTEEVALILSFANGQRIPVVVRGGGELIFSKGAVVERDKFEAMMDEYYTARGWDTSTGLQKKETLEALGLSAIVPEMQIRGLLGKE